MPARGRETSAGNDNRLNVTAFNGKAVTERSERSMPRTYGNIPRNTRQRGQKKDINTVARRTMSVARRSSPHQAW